MGYSNKVSIFEEQYYTLLYYILTQVSQVLELASSEQGNIYLLAAYQKHAELK